MNRIFYFLLLAVFVVLFLGCQNNSEVVEPDLSMKVQPVPEVTVNMPEIICAGEQFAVKVSVSKNAQGMLRLMISSDNGISWKQAAEKKECNPENEFYIRLINGLYKLQVLYFPEIYSDFSENYSEIIERKVSDCLNCEEILLEPNLTGGDFLVSPGRRNTFTVEYGVTACDQDYKELKLQGKLIANAVYLSSYPEGAEVNYKNQNCFISWNIGDIETGYSKTFSITFEYLIPGASSGTHIPLTGGWVVTGKNEEGIPVSTGDHNEIFIQIK
jgi:hypothetical protein